MAIRHSAWRTTLSAEPHRCRKQCPSGTGQPPAPHRTRFIAHPREQNVDLENADYVRVLSPYLMTKDPLMNCSKATAITRRLLAPLAFVLSMHLSAQALPNDTGFTSPDLGAEEVANLSAPKTTESSQFNRPIGQTLADEIATGMGFSKVNSFTNQQYLEIVLGAGVTGDPEKAVFFGQSVGLFINNIGFPLYSTVNGEITTSVLSSFGLIVDPAGNLESLANDTSPSKQVNTLLTPDIGYLAQWCDRNGCKLSLVKLYESFYPQEAAYGYLAQQAADPFQLVTNTKDGATTEVGMSMSPSIWLTNFILLYALNPKFAALMPAFWTPIPPNIATALHDDGSAGQADFSQYAAELPDYKQLLEVFAGTGAQGSGLPEEGPARLAALRQPGSSAVDAAGNVYIADTGNNVVVKVTSSGLLSVIAGGGAVLPGVLPALATSAQLSAPQGVAVDAAGNLYIADTGNNVVEKVTPAGMLTVIAGGGAVLPGVLPGLATSAQLSAPRGVAVDGAGNVYIADTGNNVVVKVTSSGMLSVIAGGGSKLPNNVYPATLARAAQLSAPQGVAVDADGNVYIADTGNNLVEVLDVVSGNLYVLAGGGAMSPQDSQASTGWPEHFGLGTNIRLNAPQGVAVDASGIVYIADTGNNVIERITAGIFSVVDGGGTSSPQTLGQGTQATSVELNAPQGITIDASGVLYVTDTGNNMVEGIQGSMTAPPAPYPSTPTPVPTGPLWLLGMMAGLVSVFGIRKLRKT